MTPARPLELDETFGTVREVGGILHYRSPAGVEWAVHDVCLLDGRRRRLPFGHHEVTMRCFVQADGAMMIYRRRVHELLPLTPSAIAQQMSAAEWTGGSPARDPSEHMAALAGGVAR